MTEKPPEPPALRLTRRLLAYSSVGFGTYLLDLSVIALLHFFFTVDPTVAVGTGFLIGISVNYALCYLWVYRGTRRNVYLGLGIFLVLALGGVFCITIAVSFLTETYQMHLLIARTLVAACVGLVNFLLNTFLNFKLV